jgi:quinol-cytochrome oxidoreductase complex cytochrome b subunit
MRVQQAPWSSSRVGLRRAPWPLHKDFLAVVVMCVIFGLQILAIMECAGGPEAYSAIASEGMQSP